MRPVTVQVGPLAAASANNIAQSQSLASAGNLVINGSATSGGVATLDKARFVIITSAGNDSGLTWTVTGTDWAGNTISDTFAGASGAAAQSNLVFLTVTSISGSSATASTVTAGTNALAASPWVRMDDYAFAPAFAQFDVNGTVNFTFQGTMDDPNDVANPVPPSAVQWSSGFTTVIGASATVQAQIPVVPKFVRTLLNSGSGSVSTTITQYGVAPR